MSQLCQEVSHPYRDLAVEAAQRAGRILRGSFRQVVAVQTKSQANFVSEVDLRSERAIAELLQEAVPQHELLAEEGVHPSQPSEQLWVVDPLDGTSNYLHRIPHFAVSIAYAHHGQSELGLVYNPMTEDWFYAVRGQGAWYNGTRLAVSVEDQLADTLLAIGFYYDRGRMMEATLAAVADLFRQQIHGIRRFGAAALDLAQVARGDYGAFLEFKLQPWDHAAGGLLVEEAGGQITDCRNQPLSVRHSSSVLATNGRLHAATLKVIAPHFAASQG
jgi:myo-inositol-1(or 4)-monophosphatase